MFKAFWMVIVVLNGEPQMKMFGESAAYPSRAACETHVAGALPRAADYFRGALNQPFDSEIAVKGACEAAGDPA